MTALAQDGAMAERVSIAARERAESWRWSTLARDWLQSVVAVHASRRNAVRA